MLDEAKKDKEKKIIKGIDKSIPKISNDFQYDAY